MNTSPRSLVLLELNEVNFDIVKKYIDLENEKFPALEAILKGPSIRTTSEDKYEELEPWIQWPSVHTSKRYSEHGVFRLGDMVNSDIPQIFEAVEEGGFTVGIVSAMNAVNRLKRPAYFIPDPWTQTPPDSSWWSRSLSEAISQVVNDNAQAKITFKSLIQLSLSFFRFARLTHYSKYLSFLVKCRKKPWFKALTLDLLLHDAHWCMFNSKKPSFSTLFLNAGAHIQHHYFFNSLPIKNSLLKRNPEWYIKENEDPLSDVLGLYNLIISEFFRRKDIDIILATGLSQTPYGDIKYYYRLNSHADFLREIGIKFKDVFPRMTRDFLIEFENETQAFEAKRILTTARVSTDGLPMFGEIEDRGSSLFVTLTYPYEITDETQYIIGDQIESLLPKVSFVAIKNGAHQPDGFAFFSPKFARYAPPNLSHVACLGISILNYFGLAKNK